MVRAVNGAHTKCAGAAEWAASLQNVVTRRAKPDILTDHIVDIA
jgi:hypothetical protein